MAPSALVPILLAMHFDVIVKRPAWAWVAVLGGVLATTYPANRLYRKRPTLVRLHLRILVGAAAVTSVIYLTGWGPALVGAYAFLALDGISQDGSEVWPIVTFWSLVAIALGQVGIAQGWLPRVLLLHQANALASMGAFVLVFVIRLAAAIMEKKESAEDSVRLSEDRFRSLIQNSSDTTLVIDGNGVCTFASPAIIELIGYTPQEMVGRLPTDFVHPDDRDRVQDYLGNRPERGSVGRLRPVPDDAKGRRVVRGGGSRVQPTRPPVGVGLCGQPPRHHRAQGIRGLARPPGLARSRSPGWPTDSCSWTGLSGCWPGRAVTRSRWLLSSSTSTTSRRQTTLSATRPATACCRRWPPASSPCCGPATRSAASEVTSS